MASQGKPPKKKTDFYATLILMFSRHKAHKDKGHNHPANPEYRRLCYLVVTAYIFVDLKYHKIIKIEAPIR